MNKLVPASLAFAAACLFGTAPAHAQTPTVISSLPYVINASGDYVLNRNLSSSQTNGNLIEIKASNVTVDFQGHFISGPVGNTSQSTNGIYANERSNVTIKNGTVAHCRLGIFLVGNDQTNTNAVGLTVDNMRVTYCYYEGIGMTNCRASTITNCKVSQTGYSGAASAWGIYCFGGGETIQNNTINTVAAGNSYGIAAYSCFARQNTVCNAGIGIAGGKYQDNLTLGCGLSFSNGTDAGGNN